MYKTDINYKPIISGTIASSIEAICTWPMENIKTRLQIENKLKPRYNTMYSCLQYHIKNKNIFGLYNGIQPILSTSLLKGFVRFYTYDKLQNTVFKNDSIYEKFYAGLGSGIFEAIFVTTPVETI